MAWNFDFTFRRFFVLAISIALIVISAIGLSRAATTGSVVVQAVILAIAVIGLIGTLQDNPRWMQLFLLLLVALLIWEIIYILVAAISYKRSVSSLGYDIALAALLAIGVGQWHTHVQGANSQLQSNKAASKQLEPPVTLSASSPLDARHQIQQQLVQLQSPV